MMGEALNSPVVTVRQFAARHPAISESALRWAIFRSAPRRNSRGDLLPGNGLEQSGAILRLGRRVLVHEQRFFDWLAKNSDCRKTEAA